VQERHQIPRELAWKPKDNEAFLIQPARRMAVKREIELEAKSAQRASNPNWCIQVFYDGDCPLCRREIAALRRMDRRSRILFTDIAASDFCPEAHGKSMSELMDQIHGRLPDGSWVVGVEVFRRLYDAIGFT
jgi:hypothetical protein